MIRGRILKKKTIFTSIILTTGIVMADDFVNDSDFFSQNMDSEYFSDDPAMGSNPQPQPQPTYGGYPEYGNPQPQSQPT
ncbi:MAG TPA: hypothetical protein EYG60_04265 [Campylobacterales bacterium]|nr:hypothetical protein [Campylobacterales bacterium]